MSAEAKVNTIIKKVNSHLNFMYITTNCLSVETHKNVKHGTHTMSF